MSDDPREASETVEPAENELAEPEVPAGEPDWKDLCLRTQAEFDNYRKRSRREMLEQQEWSNRNLLLTLLPVLDDFERALNGAESQEIPPAFLEGIDLVRKGFMSALEKAGVQRIVTVGQGFDPHLHEAIASYAVANLPPNAIAAEIRPGYTLGQRVLRAAQVIVVAAAATEAE